MANKFELVDATPRFNDKVFEFQLTRELLDVGTPEKIYYSMHGAQFRKRGGGVNFRPVVDSWWAAMHETGEPDQYDYPMFGIPDPSASRDHAVFPRISRAGSWKIEKA